MKINTFLLLILISLCVFILLYFDKQGEECIYLVENSHPLALVSCSDIHTCNEAKVFYMLGARRLDGDNDQIPCENLCK